MSDYDNFEEEEEALFADDDPTADSDHKGPRLVPDSTMSDFIAWLSLAHPEILGVDYLDRQNVRYLVNEFEHENGRSGYTIEQWVRSLQEF